MIGGAAKLATLPLRRRLIGAGVMLVGVLFVLLGFFVNLTDGPVHGFLNLPQLPGQGAALLFDESYAPKPAFTSVIQALGGGTPSPSPSVSHSPSPSPSTSSTAPPPPVSGCTVTYRVVNQWPGGFQGDVKITNTGTTPVNGWTLRWTYVNGQVISQLWEGVLTQSGASVAVANPTDHNITIAPNATVEFGFLSSWNNSTNAPPASFTLNGSGCATA